VPTGTSTWAGHAATFHDHSAWPRLDTVAGRVKRVLGGGRATAGEPRRWTIPRSVAVGRYHRWPPTGRVDRHVLNVAIYPCVTSATSSSDGRLHGPLVVKDRQPRGRISLSPRCLQSRVPGRDLVTGRQGLGRVGRGCVRGRLRLLGRGVRVRVGCVGGVGCRGWRVFWRRRR